jgi:hypothetical protein
MEYKSQSKQDRFVLHMLQNKEGGYFLELGSSHPVNMNNSYVLESKMGWRGVMVEYDKQYKEAYKLHRPNSIHIFQDATTVDYLSVFSQNNFPKNMDYLQIDLEVNNGTTLNSLINIDKQLLDEYKFAVITFEHDVYRCENRPSVREVSRQILEKRGYIRVLDDVSDNHYPYEDWYVHPDLVDMQLVNTFIENNKNNYIDNHKTGKMIEARDIVW